MRLQSLCSSTKVRDCLDTGDLLPNYTDHKIAIFDSLAGLLVVDELEEDGSGMYYSDDSSVASSNTAG